MALTDAERRCLATAKKTSVKKLIFDIPYLSHTSFTSLSQPILLIDVRQPEEIAVSTLSDSIPVTSAREALTKLERNTPPTDSITIVCFCTVGLRSGLYARSVTGEGRVFNYSLMEHVWAGGRAVCPNGDEWTGDIHVFHISYAHLIPEWCTPSAFGNVESVIRSVPSLPSLISAHLWSGTCAEIEEEQVGV